MSVSLDAAAQQEKKSCTVTSVRCRGGSSGCPEQLCAHVPADRGLSCLRGRRGGCSQHLAFKLCAARRNGWEIALEFLPHFRMRVLTCGPRAIFGGQLGLVPLGRVGDMQLPGAFGAESCMTVAC